MTGVQNIPIGAKTIGWEIAFNKKSPKSEEYFQIKIIL